MRQHQVNFLHSLDSFHSWKYLTVHSMGHIEFTGLGGTNDARRAGVLFNTQHSDNSYHTITEHRYVGGNLPAGRLNERAWSRVWEGWPERELWWFPQWSTCSYPSSLTLQPGSSCSCQCYHRLRATMNKRTSVSIIDTNRKVLTYAHAHTTQTRLTYQGCRSWCSNVASTILWLYRLKYIGGPQICLVVSSTSLNY